MNRYFYVLEENNGRKYIRLEANIFIENECLNGLYCEWAGFYISLEEAQKAIRNEVFYNAVDELAKYCDSISLKDAQNISSTFFNGDPGISLDILNITDETPCGDYYTDVPI